MLNSSEEIGLATIYRVLTQFEQAGLLIKHHFENDKANKAIFELNEQSHHDHIVCLQCGNVEEFQNPEIEKLQADVADKLGYNIIEHSLYVYGDCKRKDCACRLGGQENINKCHK